MQLPRGQGTPPPTGPARGGEPEADLAPRGDSDRFVAAFCYFFASLIPIAVIVYLLSMRTPGHRRYHAQQGIAFALIVLAFELVAGGLGYAIVAALAPLPFELWYAYRAYAADGPFAIPLVTPLARRLFPNFPVF